MSDHHESLPYSDRYIPTKLKIHICLFAQDKQFIDSVEKSLNHDTYQVTVVCEKKVLIDLTQDQEEKIDCLLLTDQPESRSLLSQLQRLGILLPIAIASCDEKFTLEKTTLYHPAEVKFTLNQTEPIGNQINLALTQFLNLTPHSPLPKENVEMPKDSVEGTHNLLTLQQRRLTDKLKERLGYLGVYYKRNSQDFYRNLKKTEQKKLLEQLSIEYRKIILSYFEDEPNINQIIDRFVNLAFFSDISVSQILEIHMELMDEFAQQLKLEGRNEDILLDYRLAIIDIIAHLCEMYRRSIPREGIPMDLLFKVD